MLYYNQCLMAVRPHILIDAFCPSRKRNSTFKCLAKWRHVRIGSGAQVDSVAM
jgi:hypothetical protein